MSPVPPHHSQLAKLTPPRLPAIVERLRLYRLLDRARERPIVWISAPPGFGKTTLVAGYLRARKIRSLWYQVDEGDRDLATFFHYLGLAVQQRGLRQRSPLPHLTPEYLQGLSTFTRRFFEGLYERLPAPALLVLDNYQEVPRDAHFHEMVMIGMEALPAGIDAMVISRESPPPVFARLHANRSLSFVEQDSLRLTKQEARAVVQLHRAGRPPHRDQVEALYQRFHGWVAGIVLQLEQSKTDGMQQATADQDTPQVLFDYLAREVMQRLSPEMQTFLMQTAFLPDMTGAMAHQLTGIESASSILAELHRARYFTERRMTTHEIFQYHPLFRDFLRDRAGATWTLDEIRRVRRAAASLLEAAGHYEEAVSLYRDAGGTDDIVQLILAHGPELLGQGRSQTLEAWLRQVPAEDYERQPWLSYWLGNCRLAVAPFESERILEQAFTAFRVRNDRVGMLLAWAGVVSSIRFSFLDPSRLDRWIDVLLDLLSPDASMPSKEIEVQVTFCMVMALMWRRPHTTVMNAWIDRAKRLLQTAADVEKHMFLSGAITDMFAWMGDMVSAEKYMTMMEAVGESDTAPPLTRLICYTDKAVLTWRGGEAERAIDIAEQGLEIAGKTGVHVFDAAILPSCVYGALFQSDVARAGKYLNRLAPLVNNPLHLMYGNFLLMQGWLARLQGDYEKAWAHIKEGFEIDWLNSTPFAMALQSYAAADLLYGLGSDREARRHLDLVKQIGKEMDSVQLEFMVELLESRFAFEQGRETEGFVALKHALALGNEKRFSLFPWWTPVTMARLCAKGLEAKIEVHYVQDLIRKTRLVPDGQTCISEAWPWPVKVYTLGRFDIQLDGLDLPSRRKAPYRVLQLLKVLIAGGGRDIPVSRLIDTLWPDAEGDAGHETFHKTLQRLRRLLRHDHVIQVKEGKVTLNRELCWIDAMAFEALLENRDNAGDRQPDAGGHILRSEQAVALYRGPFLDDDECQDWIDRRRERLRRQFAQAVRSLSEWRKDQGQQDAAFRCLNDALKAEPLAEPLYLRLITWCQAAGRQNDAKAVWAQYRRAVVEGAGREPSAEMCRLAKSFS